MLDDLPQDFPVPDMAESELTRLQDEVSQVPVTYAGAVYQTLPAGLIDTIPYRTMTSALHIM